MRESDALAIMIAASIEQGGEYPETRLLSSGPRTNPWFQETSDRIIQNGDMLAFDTDLIGPMGFYNDLSRSWVVGDKNRVISNASYTTPPTNKCNITSTC